MNCVVLAGGIPAFDDPLYSLTQGQPKAFLRFGQETLLDKVLQALHSATNVDKVAVVGIAQPGQLTIRYPYDFLPSQGTFVDNIFAGVDWLLKEDSDSKHALFCTSDIPTLTSPIIDSFIAQCQPLDYAAYYPMVTKEAMEARFPGSKRTFVHLTDANVAGGDLVIARPDLADEHRELLLALTDKRKQAWKLARIIGPFFLLRFLLHRLSIADIETTATRVIGHPVKILLSPVAEIAMDIDKPEQYELIRQSSSVGATLAE